VPSPRMTKTRKKWQLTVLATFALIMGLVGAALGGATAVAADNPFERGPDPTPQSIAATRGPFAISQTTVPRQNNFGGGTIYFPTDTSQGTFGAVAISPGFTEAQLAISWLGPRLASQGFVVFTIDTSSTLDFPDARADQLLAALDYLTNTSNVRNRVDRDRLGVMGHSMGGGASLSASNKRPALQAAIPLAGWHTTKNWSNVRVPTLVVAAQNDLIAPTNDHSLPFYNSLPNSPGKAFLELRGAGHNQTNSPDTTTARFSISWLKRFIDNDTRYDQFLCPPPQPDTTISRYLSTCPYTS
jgi:alpha-beta hydrolase superfamily lysophospholipase